MSITTAKCYLFVGLLASVLLTETLAMPSFAQPPCCTGIKEMQDAIMCVSPCCPGHREEVSEAPYLGLMVYCKPEKSSEISSDYGESFNLRKRRYAGHRRSLRSL